MKMLGWEEATDETGEPILVLPKGKNITMAEVGDAAGVTAVFEGKVSVDAIEPAHGRLTSLCEEAAEKYGVDVMSIKTRQHIIIYCCVGVAVGLGHYLMSASAMARQGAALVAAALLQVRTIQEAQEQAKKVSDLLLRGRCLPAVRLYAVGCAC